MASISLNTDTNNSMEHRVAMMTSSITDFRHEDNNAMPLFSAVHSIQQQNQQQQLPVPVRAQIFDYRGERIAGFQIGPCNQILCLPQVFELFLKQFVGGLHTVYTKMKRLGIHPLICTVEQIRALRTMGAILPGVNRCKLIRTADFETLYRDCLNTGARPGRPPKRIEDTGSSSSIADQDQWRSPSEQFRNDHHVMGTSGVPRSFTDESRSLSSSSFSPTMLSSLLLQQFRGVPLPPPITTDQAMLSMLISQAGDTMGVNAQQLLLGLPSMAAAILARQQQQQEEIQNRQNECDALQGEEREQSIDCMAMSNAVGNPDNSGEFNNNTSSGASSSASTTMHGDVVELLREDDGRDDHRGVCSTEDGVPVTQTSADKASGAISLLSEDAKPVLMKWFQSKTQRGSTLSASPMPISETSSATERHSASNGAINRSGESSEASDESNRCTVEDSRSKKLRVIPSYRGGHNSDNNSESDNNINPANPPPHHHCRDILSQINTSLERMEKLLNGHCEQFSTLAKTLQNELQAVRQVHQIPTLAHRRFHPYLMKRRILHHQQHKRKAQNKQHTVNARPSSSGHLASTPKKHLNE